MKLRYWRGLEGWVGATRPHVQILVQEAFVLAVCLLFPAALSAQDLPIINIQPRCQFVSLSQPATFSVMATNPAWVQKDWVEGDWNGSTNLVKTGQTMGTLEVVYLFLNIPDSLHVYYEGSKIFDSGPVSGSGTFWINYGPGQTGDLVFVVDEGGNPNMDTGWNYQASYSVSLAYQWQKDGVDLAGATNSSYTIPSVESSDVGVYSVIVSNQVGTVMSDSVFLSLQPAPQLRIVLTSTNTVVLAWPAPSDPFVLQQSDSMVSGTWIPSADIPDVVGNENQIVQPVVTDTRYYRLGVRQ